jgi:hypothetical protein
MQGYWQILRLTKGHVGHHGHRRIEERYSQWRAGVRARALSVEADAYDNATPPLVRRCARIARCGLNDGSRPGP